ncbi:MAG: LysM peptidoglycan-binding domain-containing protein [Actinomycetota bacterium]
MNRTYVRRRRVTLALVAIGLAGVVSGPVANAVGQRAPGADLSPVANVTYVVRDGDTIWSIATVVAHGRDPRAIVDAIEVENGVDADDLVSGMALSIPRA